MSAYENWCQQTEALKSSLTAEHQIDRCIYQIRHAVMQTEQSTLSEIEDDVLRQQCGILFHGLKHDLDMMTAVTPGTVLCEREKTNADQRFLQIPDVLILCVFFMITVLSLLRLQWILAAAGAIGAGVTLICAKLRSNKPSSAFRGTMKSTVQPDTERMIALVSESMSEIDRCVIDLEYLNSTSSSEANAPNRKLAGNASALLTALYDLRSEGTDTSEALLAITRLLECEHIAFCDYSPDQARLFSVLPSKNDSCTVTPALLDEKDGALLYRGTAVVKDTSVHQEY